jgi:hypothetical protein
MVVCSAAMTDTDDESRPPADLNYATEKIIRTVDELALSERNEGG